MFTSIVMARTQLSKKDGLTYKQRTLVDTLVATGCTITEASQKAGYAKGEAGEKGNDYEAKLWREYAETINNQHEHIEGEVQDEQNTY